MVACGPLVEAISREKAVCTGDSRPSAHSQTEQIASSPHLMMWVNTSLLLVCGHRSLSHAPHPLALGLQDGRGPDWVGAEVSEVSHLSLGHVPRGTVPGNEIGNLILFSQVAREDEWQGVDLSADPNRVPAGRYRTRLLGCKMTGLVPRYIQKTDAFDTLKRLKDAKTSSAL